jgi:chromosome segregation ATPase
MKTRTELEASLKTLTDRRPGLAKLVEDGRAQPHQVLGLDRAIGQVTREIEALDRREAEKGAQSRPRGRKAAAAAAVDWDAQRQVLLDLRETTKDKLAQLAESRRSLLLDGTEREITAVEAEMAKLTADSDRIRDSLAELDRRQAAAETKAAATERREREKALDGKLTELGALGGQLADLALAAEPILAHVDELEHEIVALAGGLGRRLADVDRRRPLFSRMAVGRLGVKVAAFFISPTDLVGIEERLRKAPVVPAPRTRESKPPRTVPFAPGDPVQGRDFEAEHAIEVQQARAKAMTANR